MKTSAALIGDKWVDVWKDPVTDPGKRSKKGRITLIKSKWGNIQTIPEWAIEDTDVELLETVWENGELKRDMTFAEVRANASI